MFDSVSYTADGAIRTVRDGVVSTIPDVMSLAERQEVGRWEKAGNKIASYAPPAPVIADYQNAIQALIDQTAVDKLFNDGVTLASYVASTVEPWAQQAQAFVAWRDAVWQYAYSELAKVQSGARPQPSVTDFLLELPKITWP